MRDTVSETGGNRSSENRWYRRDGDDVLCQVRVQARGSRNEIAGVRDGRLRLKLTSPPVDGRANAQACQVLADLFGVPASRVTLVRGQRAPDKLFRVLSPSRFP